MSDDDNYQCSFPRCRQPLEVVYLSHANVGKGCWTKLCEAYEKGIGAENKLLNKIGLRRNPKGEVVLINKRCNGADEEFEQISTL